MVLSKYFFSLDQDRAFTSEEVEKLGLSPLRQRLHILYFLDFIFNRLHKETGQFELNMLLQSMKPVIDELVVCNPARGIDIISNYQRRVNAHLTFWEKRRYFNEGELKALQNLLDEPVQRSQSEENTVESGSKLQSTILPHQHGDSSSPWFDLPAANIVEQLKKNKSILTSSMKRPFKLEAGLARPSIQVAVQSFLQAADRLSNHTKLEHSPCGQDFDELGQIICRDNEGSTFPVDTYYGWSISLCERIKTDAGNPPGELTASEDRDERVPNRPQSRSPRRHNRESGSPSRSRSRSRSRSQSPSAGFQSRTRSSDRGYSQGSHQTNQPGNYQGGPTPLPPRPPPSYPNPSNNASYQGHNQGASPMISGPTNPPAGLAAYNAPWSNPATQYGYQAPGMPNHSQPGGSSQPYMEYFQNQPYQGGYQNTGAPGYQHSYGGYQNHMPPNDFHQNYGNHQTPQGGFRGNHNLRGHHNQYGNRGNSYGNSRGRY